MTSQRISKAEKIILLLHEMSNGGKSKVRYEDIVVTLFKKYPNDFHLKGYPEYPDSGDLIHKPLYNFRKRGYISAANKVFSLTESGIFYVEQVMKLTGDVKGSRDYRFSRSTETEINRVKNLEGFLLFRNKQSSKLTDADFYNYLNASVRTEKHSFLNRIENMNAVAEELEKHKDDPLKADILGYHRLLLEKHKDIINHFSNK